MKKENESKEIKGPIINYSLTKELNQKEEQLENGVLQEVPDKEIVNMPVWKEVITDDKGNQYIAPKGYELSFNKDGEADFIAPFLKEGKFGKYVHRGYLAEYLIKNVPSAYSTGVLFLYDNGVYRPIKENEDKGIVKALLTPQYSSMDAINDGTKQWRIDERINKFPEEFNNNPYLLNLKNGILNIENNDNWFFTEGHSPEYLSTIQIQANYNKDAKGENFKKFLSTSVPNPEVQMLLQEMVGYCLTSFTKSKQMIFILTGKGDSGKSTFINATLEGLLNDNAKSHVPLQDLDGNEYNQAKLYGKIVNIFADLPDKSVKEIGYLKAATGNDPIPARRIYEAPFEFKNKAKFVFSSNSLPANFSKDSTDAFYNRLTLIPFNETITKKDPDLNKALEKELDFILMWALEGLHRVIKNKWKFTTNEMSEGLKAEYKKYSNPVMAFVEDYCELGEENETARAILFAEWEKFCKQNGHISGSQTKFNKNIENLYGDKVKKSQMNNPKRTKSWKGIRIVT